MDPINQITASGPPSLDQVRALESELLELPQVDLQTSTIVHGGVCARTIFIPADTVLSGALTNCDNVCVVFGDITVTTDDGVQRLVGHNVLAAKSGAKRAGYTHADTWWTTLHRTDQTDFDAVAREMTDEHSRLQSNAFLPAPTARNLIPEGEKA